MIRFPCGACGERLSVPEKYAGRKGACPNCGNINRVPGGPSAAAPVKPVFVELPQPVPSNATPQANPAPAPASPAPHADMSAAPVPAMNTGAELAERPDRWTRGPIQIEPLDEDDDARATVGGALVRFFTEGSDEENQWVLGHRKQWQVDKRGMPMFAKVAILLACVLALIGIVWGFFYLLLKLVIAVNG